MNLRRIILCLLLMVTLSGAFCPPRAEAMDPFTWAILAPFAIQAAKTASPYVIRGFFTGMKGFLKIGMDVLEVFKLPIGALGCTAGAPFGFFDSGVKYVAEGCIAPFKLAFHAVMLPVMFCGIDVP